MIMTFIYSSFLTVTLLCRSVSNKSQVNVKLVERVLATNVYVENKSR
jgi:hypothetical protein